MAMLEVGFPVAFITTFVWPGVLTTSLLFVLEVLAPVAGAISPVVDTFAMLAVILPFAGVVASIGMGQCADTMR